MLAIWRMLAIWLVIFFSGLSVFSGCSRSQNAPNVILIIVDALRADHLGAYGYAQKTSPFFDRWCKQGALFEHVTSQSSWTKTSMASLLSGLEAETVQVFLYEDTLPEEVDTLAEILSRHGYQTGYVQTNPWLLDKFGFHQGYDDYAQLGPDTENWPEKKVAYRAWAVNEQARIWLSGRDRERPFFLYLHYMDVHSPYIPPPPHNRLFDPEFPRELRDYIFSLKFLYDDLTFSPLAEKLFEKLKKDQDMLSHLISLYDGEIHYFDQEFEKLIAYLEKMGLLENTLIVLASDHGEQFLEHGKLRHANSLYREELEVPLVFSLPRRVPPGKRIAQHVRNLDILPTILDILRIKHDLRLAGRTLTPFFKGQAYSGKGQMVPAFSGLKMINDTRQKSARPRDDLDYASIRYREWVLIRDRIKGSEELYNLTQDSGEKHDLVRQRPDIVEDLSLRLDEHFRSAASLREELGMPGVPVKTLIDDETRKRLEAVGYFTR